VRHADSGQHPKLECRRERTAASVRVVRIANEQLRVDVGARSEGRKLSLVQAQREGSVRTTERAAEGTRVRSGQRGRYQRERPTVKARALDREVVRTGQRRRSSSANLWDNSLAVRLSDAELGWSRNVAAVEGGGSHVRARAVRVERSRRIRRVDRGRS
jgi:hypothetical protein